VQEREREIETKKEMGSYIEDTSSDLKANNHQIFRPEPIRFSSFPCSSSSNLNSNLHDSNSFGSDLILSNFQNSSMIAFRRQHIC